jgi:hypothetical protein
MAKADWHIAQLNVGRIVAPTNSPVLADFMGALDHINAMAEQSPGFVWRLQGDGGNATDILTTPDPYFLINMSVWKSIEELFEFVYRSTHTSFMVRRREWFERPAEAYQVLWWVPAGYLPSPTEALARLDYCGRMRPRPTRSPSRSTSRRLTTPRYRHPICGPSPIASAGRNG